MLKAEHITVGYDRTNILSELSLRLPKGKITALIGPNGCGKSTLLKALSRILTPSAGRILLNGKKRTRYVRQDRSQKKFHCYHKPSSIPKASPYNSWLSMVVRLTYPIGGG